MDNESIICLFVILWLLGTAIILWVIGFTEFSYFSPSLVNGLYNLFAPIYRFKWLSPFYQSTKLQDKLFVTPLKNALEGKLETQVLDLACGSGRMSCLLLQNDWFDGQIEAIDFSEGMLAEFASRLKSMSPNKQSRITINKMDLTEWAGKANHYDVVILTEASEFLPNFPELVRLISDSLKVGGLFLLTKPPEWLAWLYFGRKQRASTLKKLLQQHDFTDVKILSWSPRYDVVQAWKRADR